ncbi:MAG: aminomethyl-transferring glycine dehydrogenase [Nitriliruptoraceae bacterium]
MTQPSTPAVRHLEDRAGFHRRHLGVGAVDRAAMLSVLGYEKVTELLDATVPGSIRDETVGDLPEPTPEHEVLGELRAIAAENDPRTPLIGLGYHATITPAVLRRNVLEDPGWYTAYTPYQPEISQGRLEALLTFQTMVTDLTGTELAGASLLDEATAAAEAVQLCRRVSRKTLAGSAQDEAGDEVAVLDRGCHPQTIAVVAGRARPLGLEVAVTDLRAWHAAGAPAEVVAEDGRTVPLDRVATALLQSPDTDGVLHDDAALIGALQERDVLVTVATDLLACTLTVPPGEQGADVVVGSAQRFGVPLFAGGPHAAFLATRQRFSRHLPGRLVGVSQDTEGREAYRLALQTREQHIRREKATSNICTAQVLLAVVAALYAVHHGPGGLSRIARRVHALASALRGEVVDRGLEVVGDRWFDTITLYVPGRAHELVARAAAAGYDLGVRPGADGTLAPGDPDHVRIALDETTTREDVAAVLSVLTGADIATGTVERRMAAAAGPRASATDGIPAGQVRTSAFLEDHRFHAYRSETELVRWLRELKSKDIALDRAMIPLGSCTMKLNAAAEMEAVSWPAFADLHPFQPLERSRGTRRIIGDLEHWLAEITGYDAVSLQPNSGAQGELAGLLAIRGYHRDRGEAHRDVCLIPSSAHGTNAASAVMAGMRVRVVACDEAGNVDAEDLRRLVEEHAGELAALMVTYPSTHGVFEADIAELCALVHDHGGQVYLDGANLNALVGIAKPGHFGADVSHLNLHKTFCIPHGGGGPGVGPVGCRAHLAPYLPTHPLEPASGNPASRTLDPDAMTGPVSGAPWGSAGILQISWAYVKLMGASGLRAASELAILNANYVASRLREGFPVLYTGANGLVAHEAIVDVRGAQRRAGITNEDVAKRLIDHGFHAPTMSWPVAGTLMIEPTESESKAELDRFCDAMLAIAEEIRLIEDGVWPREDNPLVHAPHVAADLLASNWDHAYSREVAAYPSAGARRDKYWPPVSRIDNAYGDRNLVCACPPPGAFAER